MQQWWWFYHLGSAAVFALTIDHGTVWTTWYIWFLTQHFGFTSLRGFLPTNSKSSWLQSKLEQSCCYAKEISAEGERPAAFSRPSTWLTLHLLLYYSRQLSTGLIIRMDYPEGNNVHSLLLDSEINVKLNTGALCFYFFIVRRGLKI